MSMWGGGFDSDLGSKIDQMLAGRPSAKQRVEDFLVDELHVDPGKIPLSLKDARTFINEKMAERDSHQCAFNGNSMGLASVEFFKSQQDEPQTCPSCHSGYASCGEIKAGPSIGKWLCDDCEHEFTWTRPGQSSEKVTERSNTVLWPELLRVYTAFLKGVHLEADGDAPDCQECGASNAGSREAPHLCEICEKQLKPIRPPSFTKFLVTHTWREAEVQGTPDKKLRWKRPEKYPTGTRLRVTNGTESIYARVGGLFSDADIVNLASMKPIEQTSKWTVVEVLDD